MVRFSIYLIKIYPVLLSPVLLYDAINFLLFPVSWHKHSISSLREGGKGRGWNEVFQTWHLYWALKDKRDFEKWTSHRLHFFLIPLYALLLAASPSSPTPTKTCLTYNDHTVGQEKEKQNINTTTKILKVIFVILLYVVSCREFEKFKTKGSKLICEQKSHL